MNLSRLQQGITRRINRIRPVRIVTTAQLAAENPSAWRGVYPAWQADWPASLPSGPLPGLFRDRLSEALPARGTLQLRQAYVLGDHGWVFTADGRCVGDTTNYVADHQWMPRVHLPLFRGGGRHLPGRTLSLLTNWGATNFFHMQMDVLPRVDLLFQAGWKWTDFDQILLPAFSSPTIDRQLALVGLPQAKVVRVHWGHLNYFRTDELICTSYPGGRRTVLPTTVDYLRRLNAISSGRGNRRLFVQRRARTRHLRNEAEIISVIRPRGFEIIDPVIEGNVETAFHEASFVVGAHGAALANLIFCRPGTTVLELVPSDQAFPHFFTIAVHGGLNYDCLIGRSDRETIRPPGETWNSPSDFAVDVGAFAQALDRLLARAAFEFPDLRPYREGGKAGLGDSALQ